MMSELATGNTILVPIRKKGVEVVFPSIWKDLKEGKAPNLEDFNFNELNDSPMVDYPWLLMCGEAMMEDMQDSRKAFENEIDLILDSLEGQIEANKSNQ